MVFTTIEITFVSFAVVLLTILFLLLLRGGFFSLPAHSAALPETRQRDLERELRQQRAQKKSKKAAEQAKAHTKYDYVEPIPQPQKKKEKEYATVLNISKAEGPAKPKVAKAKANVKPKAAVEKSKDKAENKTTETGATTPAGAAPKRRVSVKFAEGEKREHNTSRTEPRQPRPAFEKKEREPPRIICYNCGHLGHTSKECPSAKETLLCFSCGELGHFSKDCPEKNNPARLRCYKCGGHGHVTKDCPERKKPEVVEEEAAAVDITEEITANAE